MPTRRAVTIALATAPLAGAASAVKAASLDDEIQSLAKVLCPELAQIHGEMLAISAEWNAIPLDSSTDEQSDHYADRLAALEERIIATPGGSLADVVLKLRVLRRYERDMPAPPRPHEELWEMADSEAGPDDRLLLSIARDIHRLAAVLEQAGA